MAPYTRPFSPDRSPSNVAVFADAARLALEKRADLVFLADSGHEGTPISPQDYYFSVSFLCLFFGFIIGMMVCDYVRKHEFPRLRWLGDKTHAGFSKVKGSLAKRPKGPKGGGDVEAGRGTVAAGGNGTELTSAGPFCGPMSDVELVVTPFVLPFAETAAVENCDVNVAGHCHVADPCPVADHCQAT